MKDEKKFVNDYLSDLSSLVQPEENLVNKLLDIKKKIIDINESKKKILIFGMAEAQLLQVTLVWI